MSNFIKNNFESFQSAFEDCFKRKLCPWIEDNMSIKKSPRHKKNINTQKWFLCHVLLRDPEPDVVDLCSELFSKANNLNGRTPHEYLCDQVFGYLKETYHVKKLQIKHPEIQLRLVSSEFNRETGKREIYTQGGNKREVDLEARFKGNAKCKGIHIKSNNTFAKYQVMRFRGGRNPEINSIKEIKYGVHIPVDENRYFSISDLLKNKECIKSEGIITDAEEMKNWGGQGAYKINFTKNILKFATPYQ